MDELTVGRSLTDSINSASSVLFVNLNDAGDLNTWSPLVRVRVRQTFLAGSDLTSFKYLSPSPAADSWVLTKHEQNADKFLVRNNLH